MLYVWLVVVITMLIYFTNEEIEWIGRQTNISDIVNILKITWKFLKRVWELEKKHLHTHIPKIDLYMYPIKTKMLHRILNVCLIHYLYMYLTRPTKKRRRRKVTLCLQNISIVWDSTKKYWRKNNDYSGIIDNQYKIQTKT